MENQEIENKVNETEMWRKWEHQHRRGRIFGGFIVVGVGVVFLARELGVEIPHWVLTWKMLLIVMGLFIGVKHMFRHVIWIVLVTIGTAFLVEDIIPGVKISYIIWPVIIICVGLVMIFKPRRKHKEHYWKYRMYKHGHWKHHPKFKEWEQQCAGESNTNSSDDYLDSVSIFGGVKKNIISKDFKGGNITNVFGGAEINLSQADINGKVVLEIAQVFGGTRLVVPSHWDIQSELAAVFGGVEDKRQVQPDKLNTSDKILVLKGVNVLGGIDIKSF